MSRFLSYSSCSLKPVKLACAFAVVLFTTDRCEAGSYAYTNVADTNDPYSLITGRGPLVNELGTVAFNAGLDAGGFGHFTGPNPATDTYVDTSGSFFKTVLSFAMNTAGTIAFEGEYGAGQSGIFTGPTPATDTYVDTSGLFDFVEFPAINSSGDIVFHGGGATLSSGIYRGPDPVADLVADTSGPFVTLLGRPRIADDGTVFFRGNFGIGDSGIYTGPSPATDEIVSNDDGFAFISNPSISKNGLLAFTAEATVDGARGVFTGPDPVADRRVDDTGPYDVFDDPSINASAQIIFNATLDGGGRGIFTGDDPSVHTVIRTGDTLFGQSVTIAHANFGGFNNKGQIAFRYTLADGTEGVALATPEAFGVVDTEGDWIVTHEQVFQDTDPEAHFGIKTLLVEEEAPTSGPFDLVIEADIQGGTFIEFALDKTILNTSGGDWEKVTFTLGRGVGDDFVASDEFDDLFFLLDPAPEETTGQFPTFTPDVNPMPNQLVFDGSMVPGEKGKFWLGIHAPDDLDGLLDRTTFFTIRQEVVIPEPATLVLAVLGLLGIGYRQRKRT